jgi:hypothetical protein
MKMKERTIDKPLIMKAVLQPANLLLSLDISLENKPWLAGFISIAYPRI